VYDDVAVHAQDVEQAVVVRQLLVAVVPDRSGRGDDGELAGVDGEARSLRQRRDRARRREVEQADERRNMSIPCARFQRRMSATSAMFSSTSVCK